jgi:hypothetical protein
VTLLTASWAGFAMAQMAPPVRRRLVALALLLLLTPASAVWLPRYLLFSAAGLIDAYAALVAPALMGTKSLFVLMYYWSFRRVSLELFEAARLEGAGVWASWAPHCAAAGWPDALAVLVLSFSHCWAICRPAALSQVGATLYRGGRSAYAATDGWRAGRSCWRRHDHDRTGAAARRHAGGDPLRHCAAALAGKSQTLTL